MRTTETLRRILRGFRRALDVVTRPVRRPGEEAGVVMQPYRGYGTRDEIYLMGRLFRQPRFGRDLPTGSLRSVVADTLRRLVRRGLGGEEITGRMGDAEVRVETDRDGYFHLHLDPEELPRPDDLWQPIDLEVTVEDRTIHDRGEVLVPPISARLVVISDIDDTVMHTGVASKARMLWRLFLQDADSRVAFPGVAAFYRALHDGPSGDEQNPMLYVSRAPWSIYEVLERFFRLHGIPVGPVLFLREWGLTLQRPLPRRAVDHKKDLIEDMLERYDDRPFILIGDSGQHDPEIYADVVARHPGRVRAVYIRNVSEDAARAGEIEKLARRTAHAGSPLLLVHDTAAMAEHAAREGWIAPERVANVRSKPSPGRGAEATADSARATPADVEEAVDSGPGDGPPPNVLVDE